MVTDAAPAPAVSGWVTLRRAATGAGLAIAATVLIGLAGRPVGDFVGVSVLIWSTCALYNGGDRHRRIACAAAAVTAAVVWLGTLPIPDAGLPGNVGGALLGALAASQVYAVITRVGLAAAGRAPDQAR